MYHYNAYKIRRFICDKSNYTPKTIGGATLLRTSSLPLTSVLWLGFCGWRSVAAVWQAAGQQLDTIGEKYQLTQNLLHQEASGYTTNHGKEAVHKACTNRYFWSNRIFTVWKWM